MNLDKQVESADYQMAYSIAFDAHKGQVDKCGEPYFNHPLRVSCAQETNGLAIIALLHDVVEDTPTTLDYLSTKFNDYITDAVEALTHRNNESLQQYYARILKNSAARTVKIADILDNLSPARFNKLDIETKKRLKAKYLKALSILI